MTRISLKEAYDNKDVIAQIYAIRDTAESAVDTSEQAVTTANTASEHVDALVPQVEGAVQNANSASASAQASAQTVAGYENRLGGVETGLGQTESDLSAVTLRVTTAEGDIVTIQGRVTALETADGQNVKLTGEHAIGNYALLLTDNQISHGRKQGNFTGVRLPTLTATTGWLHYADFVAHNYGHCAIEVLPSAIQNTLNSTCYAFAIFGNYNRTHPIANVPGVANLKVVSLHNTNTSKWELWVYAPEGRGTQYIELVDVYDSLQYTLVNEVGEFPTNADNIVYIMGSA